MNIPVVHAEDFAVLCGLSLGECRGLVYEDITDNGSPRIRVAHNIVSHKTSVQGPK